MSDEQTVARKREGSQALQTETVGSGPTFAPDVDIIEKQDGIHILADMPGVTKDKVDAVMEEGVLTIRGEVAPHEEQKSDMTLESSEYESGNYYRSFAVGEGLDAEGIEAKMQDGVLRLVIPKSEQYKPKKIEVK